VLYRKIRGMNLAVVATREKQPVALQFADDTNCRSETSKLKLANSTLLLALCNCLLSALRNGMEADVITG
jgi:hypothetical protein